MTAWSANDSSRRTCSALSGRRDDRVEDRLDVVGTGGDRAQDAARAAELIAQAGHLALAFGQQRLQLLDGPAGRAPGHRLLLAGRGSGATIWRRPAGVKRR